MSLRNVMLTSLLAFPFLAGTVQAKSLDQLRQECNAFRGDSQIKDFAIKLECNGKYILSSEVKSKIALPNHGEMTTDASTKGGRYGSGGTRADVAVAEQTVTCSKLVKKQMSAPEGFGIPISIKNCDDLTAENVARMCEGEVRDYCSEQFVDHSDSVLQSCKQDQNAQQEICQNLQGMCVLEKIEEVDTCDGYVVASPQHEETQVPSKM
jgi:hypothetical protein